MTWGIVASVGTSVAVGLYTGSQQRKAAQTQYDATTRASQLAQTTEERNIERQQPFYDVGVNALPGLVKAAEYKPFDMATFQQDPSYGFRLAEGQKALDRSAAARGGMISGGALRAATRYGQDMASQEYTNAYNRYQAERAAQFNRNQALVNIGQGTASTLGNTGAALAQNVGQNYMSGANAQAAGDIGVANTYNKMFGNVVNAFSGGVGGGARTSAYGQQAAAPVVDMGQQYRG